MGSGTGHGEGKGKDVTDGLLASGTVLCFCLVCFFIFGVPFLIIGIVLVLVFDSG